MGVRVVSSARRVDKTCTLCGAALKSVHYNAKYCTDCKRTLHNATKNPRRKGSAERSRADRRKGMTIKQICGEADAQGGRLWPICGKKQATLGGKRWIGRTNKRYSG